MKQRVVTCNGCVDGLHAGHYFFPGFCRAQGDLVVVGINSDRYILQHKRDNVTPQAERMAALLDNGLAGDVVPYDDETPCNFIAAIGPDVHCIGMEYMNKAKEEEVCDRLRIPVVYVPRLPYFSTTSIKGRRA
jgi:D-beta-D-heptose 7-phosphate kinase/D-beta-D-heptose 1-phosphate adenosyltransferase